CPPHSAVAAQLDPAVVQAVPMRSVWDLAARRRIGKAARRFNADIVQTYMGRATRLTHLRPGRRPVHVARLGGYYDLKGYRHAHAWVGNTRGICDYLVRGGLPARRVFPIGNFVEAAAPADPAELQRLRTALGLPADALVVTALGRLHPNKGFADLLTAFSDLPAAVGERPVHLIVVGDGPLAAELRSQATELDLDRRLHWAGWQNDPAPYYELADLFVCPSRHEPLGNVILEAWSHGLPVLATRSLGAEELIRDQDTGALVPVGDPHALSHAMAGLLRDEGARHALAGAGTAEVRRSHSREAVVGAYRAMYGELLGAL
ncbi:MAG TPA: glycosyltransferase, partial [Gammaproteobacteria bacterium]|nr:glycosyltransferase [Gammaproteobacteria bacterium]